MKYIYFYRENNNFNDILKDVNIKKRIYLKISYYRWLIIGIAEDKDPKLISYINLVYGDSIKTDTNPNRSPIPNKDYKPDQDLSRWVKKKS